MASIHQPSIYTFKADGVIPKGSVVKAGSDRRHVAKSTGATQKHVGLAQNPVAAAEDLVEVAVPGGGGKGLAGGTIAMGDYLTSDASGALVVTTTPLDNVIGQAMEDAVVGDIFSVHIGSFKI